MSAADDFFRKAEAAADAFRRGVQREKAYKFYLQQARQQPPPETVSQDTIDRWFYAVTRDL